MASDAVSLAALLDEGEQRLEQMLAERLAVGADKYGPFAFLGNDVGRMALEEIADYINYGRMLFLKTYVLVNYLADQANRLPTDKDGNQQIGFEAFKGTGLGWENG